MVLQEQEWRKPELLGDCHQEEWIKAVGSNHYEKLESGRAGVVGAQGGGELVLGDF